MDTARDEVEHGEKAHVDDTPLKFCFPIPESGKIFARFLRVLIFLC